MNTIIRVTDRLRTDKYLEVKAKDVISKNTNYYEVLHPTYNLWIKPYFEIDDNLKNIEIEDVWKIIQTLNRIFGSVNCNWAISTDHRESKYSYHLVLSGFKTTIQDLVSFKDSIDFKSLMQKYGKNPDKTVNGKVIKGSWRLDPSVYSNGFQKFRSIHSKKQTDKTSNGLIPI